MGGAFRANYSAYSIEVDEFRFMKMLKGVIAMCGFTDDPDNLEILDDLTAQEIYELLDSAGMESIGFREFCAFILLISGKQANQLLHCLYEHGSLLFDVIAGGQ